MAHNSHQKYQVKHDGRIIYLYRNNLDSIDTRPPLPESHMVKIIKDDSSIIKFICDLFTRRH